MQPLPNARWSHIGKCAADRPPENAAACRIVRMTDANCCGFLTTPELALVESPPSVDSPPPFGHFKAVRDPTVGGPT